MNYFKYFPIDVVNGEGTRCTLFVCGCEHYCHGCYNQATWPFDAGFAFEKDLEDQIVADLCDTRIKRRGLSLSGGEPLHPRNFEAVYSLLMRVRNECPPQKDVWMWTGYTLAELSADQKRIVDLVDVLKTRSSTVLTVRMPGGKNAVRSRADPDSFGGARGIPAGGNTGAYYERMLIIQPGSSAVKSAPQSEIC